MPDSGRLCRESVGSHRAGRAACLHSSGQRTRHSDWVPRRNHHATAATIGRENGSQPETDGYLPAALAALRRAVDALTAPMVDYVNGRAVTAPCLVDQLGAAVNGQAGHR